MIKGKIRIAAESLCFARTPKNIATWALRVYLSIDTKSWEDLPLECCEHINGEIRIEADCSSGLPNSARWALHLFVCICWRLKKFAAEKWWTPGNSNELEIGEFHADELWYQSDFAKNLGPELNNLVLQTEIVAQNSFGRYLGSEIANQENWKLISDWIELASGLDNFSLEEFSSKIA